MKHTANEIHKYVMRNKTVAKYQFCEGSRLMYDIVIEDVKYTFPIDVSDKREVGNAVFALDEPATLLMRYVKKSIDNPVQELRIRMSPLTDKGDFL